MLLNYSEVCQQTLTFRLSFSRNLGISKGSLFWLKGLGWFISLPLLVLSLILSKLRSFTQGTTLMLVLVILFQLSCFAIEPLKNIEDIKERNILVTLDATWVHSSNFYIFVFYFVILICDYFFSFSFPQKDDERFGCLLKYLKSKSCAAKHFLLLRFLYFSSTVILLFPLQITILIMAAFYLTHKVPAGLRRKTSFWSPHSSSSMHRYIIHPHHSNKMPLKI